MTDTYHYSARERACLWTLALCGCVALNGVFVYALLFRREMLRAILTNPVASAFVIEALLMVGLLAYLLHKWRVTRLHWGWFVLLSLMGSLAFALPIAALWPRPTTPSRRDTRE